MSESILRLKPYSFDLSARESRIVKNATSKAETHWFDDKRKNPCLVQCNAFRVPHPPSM